MQYVYAAMLLHSAKKDINEAHVEEVLKSAHIEADAAKVKAMVASLKNINIDDAIAKAAVATVAVGQGAAPHVEEKKAEEEVKKTEEEAAAGLGALFG
ncbi:MAG: 50S ribosomal protein P1 [Candidatus Diapherotrites archaeon]|nr:50S ribosomal protein P1 [Candidatus Diapherotrites archaeon]